MGIDGPHPVSHHAADDAGSYEVDDFAFRLVRRRGYDPTEVDAAIARLRASLRHRESRIRELEATLAETIKRARAAESTLASALETRDMLIDEGRQEAEKIQSQAFSAAFDLVARSRGEMASLEAEATEERKQAEDEVRNLLAEAEAVAARAEYEAHRLLDERKQLMDDARRRYDEILDDARRVAADEAADILGAARAVARSALETAAGTGNGDMVDLTGDEPLLVFAGGAGKATVAAGHGWSSGREVDPAPRMVTFAEARLPQAAVDVAHLDLAHPDGSGTLPAERPVLDPNGLDGPGRRTTG